MEITFVTGNAKKLEEVRAIVGATDAFALTSRKVDLPELQGEPEDVANVVLFLASDESRWVNGSEIMIDNALIIN